jgi:hypothetical protein
MFIGLLAFMVFLAFILALWEVQIEGKDGWAARLPTWRLENAWVLKVTGGRPLTGYHVFMIVFMISMVHLPRSACCSGSCLACSCWRTSSGSSLILISGSRTSGRGTSGGTGDGGGRCRPSTGCWGLLLLCCGCWGGGRYERRCHSHEGGNPDILIIIYFFKAIIYIM